MALIGILNAIDNILPSQIHIIVRANADSQKCVHRPDHMFCGGDEFIGQTAMANNDNPDHGHHLIAAWGFGEAPFCNSRSVIVSARAMPAIRQ
jgi:hypothetical protein